VMANYRYLPGELEHNHERFARGGEIAMSPALERKYQKIAPLWHGKPHSGTYAEAK
jgi:hypothetical protein